MKKLQETQLTILRIGIINWFVLELFFTVFNSSLLFFPSYLILELRAFLVRYGRVVLFLRSFRMFVRHFSSSHLSGRREK